MSLPRDASPTARAHGLVLGLGVAWAVGWTGFAVAAVASEGAAALPYAALFVASLVAVLGAVWLRPRPGGGAAIVAAVVGALLVDHWAVRLLLFAPALALGVVSLCQHGRVGRTAAVATGEEHPAPVARLERSRLEVSR